MIRALQQMIIGAIFILTLWISPVGALDTAIKNPSDVAPFQVCFINDNVGSWPVVSSAQPDNKTFIKASQNPPFCLNQNLTVADYQNLTAFEKDVYRTAAIWQSYFKSAHSVRFNIRVNNNEARFSGTSMPGTITSKNILTEDGSQQRVEVVYPSALSNMLGEKANSDGDILVNVKSLPSRVFNISSACSNTLSPKTFSYCKQGDGRDLITVMLHEFGHGFGIKSLRMRNQYNMKNYGSFRNNRITAYDFQTNNGNGYHDLMSDYHDHFARHQHPIYFTGNSTVNYLKSQHWASPLTICNRNKNEKLFSQNFSHFCFSSCVKPPETRKAPDLMGMWCLAKFSKQKIIDITSMDLHVLYDIGYAPVLKTTTATPNVRQTIFNPKINH